MRCIHMLSPSSQCVRKTEGIFCYQHKDDLPLLKGKFDIFPIREESKGFPYNGAFRFAVPKRDSEMSRRLRKGYLFEKYLTMAIYAFCEKGETVVDLNADVGCVSIPCSRQFSVYCRTDQKDILEINQRLNSASLSIISSISEVPGKISLILSNTIRELSEVIKRDTPILITSEPIELEGYDRTIQLSGKHFMILPIGRMQKVFDPLFQYWRVESEKGERYSLLKVDWRRDYKDVPEFKFRKEVDLHSYDHAVYSQNGEDGIINCIFELLSRSDIPIGKKYVEFGTQDGSECNTRYLRERKGWTGLLMDGGYKNKYIGLEKEFITEKNINGLFAKYLSTDEIDLLVIDIDGNDFYIWNVLEQKYNAKVVVIEYNSSYGLEDKTIVYDEKHDFQHTLYFGASITTLYKLGRKKGYSLIGTDKEGVNLFFLRNDLVEILRGKGITFRNMNNPSKLYVNNKKILRYFSKVFGKKYLTYEQALRR